jgi:hypothetical protein
VRIGDSGGRVAPRRVDEEETPVEARTSDVEIEDKIDQNRGDRRVSHVVHRGEREIIDFGSIPYYE